ncbi:MAG: hypothetical protein RI922_1486 [Bacteroidota bacterium]|jgi:hypothetical protein
MNSAISWASNIPNSTTKSTSNQNPTNHIKFHETTPPLLKAKRLMCPYVPYVVQKAQRHPCICGKTKRSAPKQSALSVLKPALSLFTLSLTKGRWVVQTKQSALCVLMCIMWFKKRSAIRVSVAKPSAAPLSKAPYLSLCLP